MTDALLKPAEVAAVLNVPVSTARYHMREMRHVYIGKHIRVTKQALDAWIARQRCGGSRTSAVVFPFAGPRSAS